MKTHGLSGTVEYKAWRAAFNRCYNRMTPSFPDYGGRGITMCERWRDDFPAFLADMGPRPDGHSIDRIDNDRGYSPDNCRWATRSQQAANRRKDFLTVKAEGIAQASGLSAKLIKGRLMDGWTDEEAAMPKGYRRAPSWYSTA